MRRLALKSLEIILSKVVLNKEKVDELTQVLQKFVTEWHDDITNQPPIVRGGPGGVVRLLVVAQHFFHTSTQLEKWFRSLNC